VAGRCHFQLPTVKIRGFQHDRGMDHPLLGHLLCGLILLAASPAEEPADPPSPPSSSPAKPMTSPAEPEIPPALQQTVRRYVELTQSAGPREWVPLIHPADIETFHAQVTGAVEILEPLGEADGMLANAGVESLAAMKALAPFELLCRTMERQMASARQKAPGELERMLESLKIDRIVPPPADSHPDAPWKIEYSFRFVMEQLEIDRRLSEEAELTQADGRWYVRLKPAMHSFAARARHQVDDFKTRAARDRKLEIAKPDEELEEFRIAGFRRVADKQVVIEPRFSSAREFYEGLAAVRPLGRWGYIKPDGTWAIEPKFSDAKDFSGGLAPVAREIDDEERWGYVDPAGREVIPFRYESADEFAEGLAAVEKDELWGFINAKGELVIPHRYTSTDAFHEGIAEVEWEDEEGETLSGFIDRTGKVVEEDE
jgi:hypothetical protein